MENVEFQFLNIKILNVEKGKQCFFVGDIHGKYTELMIELESIGFNFERDILVSLGDLIDRGPENEKCLRLLEKPWFHSVYANHDDFLLRFALNKLSDEMMACWIHPDSGGIWFAMLPEEKQQAICKYAIEQYRHVPIMLEVNLPNGKRIGAVHAELPVNDWQASIDKLNAMPNRVREYMIWKRDKAKDIIEYHEGRESLLPETFVSGIDAVVFGHTKVRQTLHYGNCAWIDTGGLSGLSVIKAESILSRVKDVHLEGPSFNQ